MVASKEVEIPCYKRIDRRQEKWFDALAQFIGRRAISFLRNYFV